jgi:CheY-like chemotaxis protein
MCNQSRRSPRILLVDDDPIFGRVMTAVATALGFDVRYVDEADGVLRGHHALGCDVLIVDYDLGELSGVELAERLCNDLDGAPVILVSSTARSPDRDGAWPPCIAGFALKSDGVAPILALAEAAWCRAEACRQLRCLRVPPAAGAAAAAGARHGTI